MLRNALFVSVAIPVLVLAGAVRAQVEVGDERTNPVSTSTIDGGNPGDIVILSAGSVLVGSGAAVNLDSDNTVTNQGTIGSNDSDNTTGILISGGVTGSFTNSGSINLIEDFTPPDTDSDGDPDGPQAIGTGRTGVLVEGASPFTGDITNGSGGNITVEGTQSAGIRINAGLDGNLTNDGSITVTGANGYGVHIAGTVNGDISNNSSISVSGENSVGLGIDAPVNGAVSNTGTIGSTGFRETTRRNSLAERAKLDADDLTAGGPAVSISASISGGFINGTVLDGSGNPSRTGQIGTQGSAAAILVGAGLDGQAGGDVVLGAVGTSTDGTDFGLINDGTITAAGLNDGFAATAITVQGAQVGGILRRAIIEHGISNTGTILGSAFEADVHTIWVRNGGVAETLSNSGTVRSTVVSQSGGQAATVAVDAGGQVSTITNTGAIEASYTGTGAQARAVAILDQAGTIDLIENDGSITATFDEVLPDGVSADPGDTTRHAVAIDLGANTTGATVRQGANSVAGAQPSITGDIVLGSGNDRLELLAGTVDSDVSFGDGADVLTIDGGAELTGALSDSDGMLVMDVRDGLLALGSDTALNLTSASFGPAARLQLTLANSSTGIIGATFNASGVVSFADGAAIAPILNTLVGDGGSFGFLTAGNLNIDGTLNSLLDPAQLPFLYEVNLHQSADGNTLVLDLRRRTASELGFDANQASAYDAWFTALSGSDDAALEAGFAQLITKDDFQSAYNQLLPEFGAAALQFTLANTDGAAGAIATRLDNLRRGYGTQGGLWAQEIGYYLDRNLTSITQPYHGYGAGIAAGIDSPFGPFNAVGIAISAFSNEISQSTGFDKPLSTQSAQIGIYSGSQFAGINFESNASVGIDDFNSNRALNFGDIIRTSKAGWTGHHFAGTSRLSYDFVAGHWFVRPSVSLDYLWLRENAHSETGGGTGFDLDIQARTSKSFSGSAAVTFGRTFGKRDESWWSPRLRAGVRNDFQGNTASTTANFAGFTDQFTLTPPQLPSTALLLGFSISAGSRFTSFGFDYDADIRSGFVRHTGRLVIRFIF